MWTDPQSLQAVASLHVLPFSELGPETSLVQGFSGALLVFTLVVFVTFVFAGDFLTIADNANCNWRFEVGNRSIRITVCMCPA